MNKAAFEKIKAGLGEVLEIVQNERHVVRIEVGQRWRTPRGRMREILKINPKSVTYRETGGGNNFVNRSYKFDLWVEREGATLLTNERKS